uniref:Uncharacterized protein n=1 Tax=Anguilla anguilla TaxID=7936 RepID=A0A0E9W7A5_ANGAN
MMSHQADFITQSSCLHHVTTSVLQFWLLQLA